MTRLLPSVDFEHFLCRALQSLLQVNETQAQELMKTLKLFHPYGVVGQLPWQEGRAVTYDADYGDLVGTSKEIRTFNEKIAEGAERPAVYSDSFARARE